MDWNNINRDRDTSGLGPIEYDQTKVPALIRKHADNVRTKTYGQEVREAQARNAELAGLIASEAETKADNADLLSKDTQNRFNNQLAGNTDINEVIDARTDYFGGNHTTLSKRIDSNEIRDKDIVYVENFERLAVETSDSDRLQRALDFAEEHNKRVVYISSDLELGKKVIVNASHINMVGLNKNDLPVKIYSGFDYSDDVLIDVKADGFSMEKLEVRGDLSDDFKTGKITGVRYDFDMIDCDSWVNNCVFKNLKTVFDMYGRNLRIENNIFALTKNVFDLHKFTKYNDIYGNHLTGIVIKNNLFHTAGKMSAEDIDFSCILRINDVTARQQIIFENNTIESSVARIVKGYYWGLQFNNNQITTPSGPYTFEFTDTPTELFNGSPVWGQITGNYFEGGNPIGGYGQTKNIIYANNIRNLKFTNNLINSTVEEAIKLEGTLSDSEITNNTFRTIGYPIPGRFSIINVKGSILNSVITNNPIFGNSHKHVVNAENKIDKSSIFANFEKDKTDTISISSGHPNGGLGNESHVADVQVHESLDPRVPFPGAIIGRDLYKRQINGITKPYVEVVGGVGYESDHTEPSGNYKINVANKGPMKNVATFDRFGLEVDGAIKIKGWYIYVDDSGNLKTSKTNPYTP